MAFRIQRFVCLCHDKVIFLVSRQINHLVCYHRIGRVTLIQHPVGSLDKTVFINPRIGCQGVDQTDIGTFRGLNGAHTAIVCVVYVTNLETGTVSGQTARAQGRQTALVGQLRQWVVLIHKLGQLGASEKFLHCRRDRLNVDQGLRRDSLHILSSHTLSDYTLHTGQTDPVLILKQLAHRTDTAVSQMVDIV